ncbi:MAG: hypothetical protein OK442_04420 [Thaumarchaeota archaeon]|nr:hypothetical protein [Nitrososphaerota archaeon]
MRIKTWIPPILSCRYEKDWKRLRLSAFIYLIGVLLKGDGSVFVAKSRRTLVSGETVTYHSHAIQLEVSSLEFATHFNLKCSLALGRPLVTVRGPDLKGMHYVTYHDKAFGQWWAGQKLATLKPFIEAIPIDYLRGRFDSDANVHDYAVTLCGAENHREIMEYDRSLCVKLGMRTGPVSIYDRKGSQTHIEGRLVTRTMDKLRFNVNAGDFLRTVGGLAVKERDWKLRSTIQGRAWTPWPERLRLRSIELSSKGLPSGEISKLLKEEFQADVPPITIYFWTRRGTRTWSEFKNGQF